MHNIFSNIDQYINNIARNIFPEAINLAKMTVEMPNNQEYGDISTNIAILLSKAIKIDIKQIANDIVNILLTNEDIFDAHVAGPGFINIKFKPHFWHKFLKSAVKSSMIPEFANVGQGQNINLEFVSVNPTGPLHVGHARGAVQGDVLANIFQLFGYNVLKEYYINDAGTQIEILIQSLMVRYHNLCGGNLQIPEGCYPGEYLIPIAQKLKDMHGAIDSLSHRELADFAVNEIMQIIKQDLQDLGVSHEIFTSEYHDVIAKGKIDQSLQLLRKKGLIYQGILEKPKGIEDESWEAKEQTIFKSTEFGDSIDRPIIKSDGSYTYFIGDIAYHYDKLERGFKKMILLLGADHGGYVKRIKAVVNALSNNTADIEVRLNQLVNLFKDGKPFKMSKRAGNFITVRDVIDEVGKDAFRFAILTKKSDTVLDIDFTKLKEQSKDNPIFYVQYAHARAKSVLRKAQELGITEEYLQSADIEPKFFDEDLPLIKSIASLPKVLQASLQYYEPHRITYYLQELANHFHQLWALGNTKHNLRFITEDNIEEAKKRLILVIATANTLAFALKILGIKPIEEM